MSPLVAGLAAAAAIVNRYSRSASNNGNNKNNDCLDYITVNGFCDTRRLSSSRASALLPASLAALTLQTVGIVGSQCSPCLFLASLSLSPCPVLLACTPASLSRSETAAASFQGISMTATCKCSLVSRPRAANRRQATGLPLAGLGSRSQVKLAHGQQLNSTRGGAGIGSGALSASGQPASRASQKAGIQAWSQPASQPTSQSVSQSVLRGVETKSCRRSLNLLF